jgi:hypothetical protein
MRLRLIDVNTGQFADPRKVWPGTKKKERGPGGWRNREKRPKGRNDEEKAQYGILSHRWLADEDEVKFHEIGQPEVATAKAEFFKLLKPANWPEKTA